MNEDNKKCPDCNSERVIINREVKTFDGAVRNYRCLNCGKVFT